MKSGNRFLWQPFNLLNLQRKMGTTDYADITDSQRFTTKGLFTRQVNALGPGSAMLSAPIREIRGFHPRF